MDIKKIEKLELFESFYNKKFNSKKLHADQDSLLDITNDRLSYDELDKQLNESWASQNVMKMINIADKNSDKAWYSSFVKDFYKTYNIAIDKIEDGDFILSDNPHDIFIGKLRNTKFDNDLGFPENKRYLAIFINDDKNLEIEASQDINKLTTALNQFEFRKDSINDLLNIAEDNPTKLKSAIKKYIKSDGVTIKDEQAISIFTELDKLKRLKSPVITSIVLGGHAVFHGFEMIKGENIRKRQFKGIPWKEDRYGVMNSPVLINRYFGLNPKTDVNKNTLPAQTTKVYYVDIQKLVDKYNLGSKLEDRKNAKKNNYFFMSEDDIKAEFQRRLLIFKKQKIDPNSILLMFNAVINTFNSSMGKAMSDMKSLDAQKFMNLQFKVDNESIKGAGNIITKFAELLTNYNNVLLEYTNYMKSLTGEQLDIIKNKNVSDLNKEETKINTQLDGYSMELLKYRDIASNLYKQMNDLGIKFTKKNEKIFK